MFFYETVCWSTTRTGPFIIPIHLWSSFFKLSFPFIKHKYWFETRSIIGRWWRSWREERQPIQTTHMPMSARPPSSWSPGARLTKLWRGGWVFCFDLFVLSYRIILNNFRKKLKKRSFQPSAEAMVRSWTKAEVFYYEKQVSN
jgi:hypothetical protein